MATWIAHLRIAERILTEGFNFSRDEFVAGNIAPDSGVPNSDNSKFNPDSSITHWKNSKKEIMKEDFFNKHVNCDKSLTERDTFSFVMGYYVHLLTDIEWGKMLNNKKNDSEYEKVNIKLKEDPSFIWIIKEDWYGQDFDYLKLNEDSIFFTCFQHLTDVKDYLDYFPKGAFNQRFKYIREMYLRYYKDHHREYKYLSKQEMDDFVETATVNILKVIDEKLKTCAICL